MTITNAPFYLSWRCAPGRRSSWETRPSFDALDCFLDVLDCSLDVIDVVEHSVAFLDIRLNFFNLPTLRKLFLHHAAEVRCLTQNQVIGACHSGLCQDHAT